MGNGNLRKKNEKFLSVVRINKEVTVRDTIKDTIKDDANLLNTYFCYLGEWGNTKLASEHCCISVSTGRRLEGQYPERYEEAMFTYRETLRGEVIKRIKDPEQFSERLLIKELEMVDHRYRTKVDVEHHHSVELVGRLERARERMIEGGIREGVELSGDKGRIAMLEGGADKRAPLISEVGEEEVIDTDWSELLVEENKDE